jgi:hypothetical protein
MSSTRNISAALSDRFHSATSGHGHKVGLPRLLGFCK